MKNEKLLVAAGSLMLAGVLALNNITLINVMKKKDEVVIPEEDISASVTEVEEQREKFTCQFEQVKLWDGRTGYKLPEGYQPYYVNQDCDYNGMMGILKENGYSIYYVSEDKNLDGYIGVKTQYLSMLNYKDNIDKTLENDNSNMICHLQKKDDGYYLSSDYVLYTSDVELRSMIDTIEKDGYTYKMSDELAEKFVGISSSTYDMLIQAEALKTIVEGEYYEYGKTDNRSK